jgi:hypothetical protein
MFAFIAMSHGRWMILSLFWVYAVFRLVCQATSSSYLDELASSPAILQIAFSVEFAHSFAWAAAFTTGAVCSLCVGTCHALVYYISIMHHSMCRWVMQAYQ